MCTLWLLRCWINPLKVFPFAFSFPPMAKALTQPQRLSWNQYRSVSVQTGLNSALLVSLLTRLTRRSAGGFTGFSYNEFLGIPAGVSKQKKAANTSRIRAEWVNHSQHRFIRSLSVLSKNDYRRWRRWWCDRTIQQPVLISGGVIYPRLTKHWNFTQMVPFCVSIWRPGETANTSSASSR